MYCISKACKSIACIFFLGMNLSVNVYALDSGVEEIQKLISGNSLKIINKFGSSILYFEPDGSFAHLAEHGQVRKGIWRATTDSMCATVFPQPYDPPKEFCLKLKNRKLGDSWLDQDPRNGELKRALLGGHPKL